MHLEEEFASDPHDIRAFRRLGWKCLAAAFVMFPVGIMLFIAIYISAALILGSVVAFFGSYFCFRTASSMKKYKLVATQHGLMLKRKTRTLAELPWDWMDTLEMYPLLRTFTVTGSNAGAGLHSTYPLKDSERLITRIRDQVRRSGRELHEKVEFPLPSKFNWAWLVSTGLVLGLAILFFTMEGEIGLLGPGLVAASVLSGFVLPTKPGSIIIEPETLTV